MATIGRAFAFYVKHWESMEVLYGPANERERDALLKHLKGEKRQEMKKKVDAVGRRAGEQAAALLSECGRLIDEHFRHLGYVASLYSRPSTIEKDWEAEYRVRRHGKGRQRTGKWVGANVIWPRGKNRPAIVLWLWTTGGREAEEELASKLEGCVEYRSHSPELEDWGWGSVIFGVVPIRAAALRRFRDLEKEGERLVRETGKALRAIGKRHLKGFWES
jgi:hypothetical protein